MEMSALEREQQKEALAELGRREVTAVQEEETITGNCHLDIHSRTSSIEGNFGKIAQNSI